MRYRLIVVGLSLCERYLDIFRVEIDKRLTCLHRLIVFHVDRGNSPLHPCSNWVQVSVNLGIIGRFVGTGMDPPHDGPEDKKHGDGKTNRDIASSFRRIDFFLLGLILLRIGLLRSLLLILLRFCLCRHGVSLSELALGTT